MSEQDQKSEAIYPPHARERPRLTQREQDIITEEKRKGLFMNSLPLAAVFGYLYYMRLKKKNLLGQSRANDIFRIGLVSGLGFGIGRFFTFKRAVERIRNEVPDGTAAKLSKGEWKGPTSWDNIDKDPNQPNEQPVRPRGRQPRHPKPSETKPDEFSQPTNLPMSDQPSAPQGLDDRFRPNIDSLETKPVVGKSDTDVSSPPSKLRARKNRYGDEIE